MKIAIISDIHDNLVNLGKCLDWCKASGAEKIICCGDVTNGETINFLAGYWTKDIYLVRGNMEIFSDEEASVHKNMKYFGRNGGRIELGGKIIGFCHEPFLINKVLEQGRCDIVFYGHTHKPWIEEKNGVKLVNPGTLSGVFSKATFAFWDTTKDEPELKILELL